MARSWEDFELLLCEIADHWSVQRRLPWTLDALSPALRRKLDELDRELKANPKRSLAGVAPDARRKMPTPPCDPEKPR